MNDAPKATPTPTPPRAQDQFSTSTYVAAIAEHLARPLPEEGFHLLRLHESRDFSSADPDDDWAELMRVSEEFHAELEDLATALDARWGPHGQLSMEDYAFLDPDDEGDEGDKGGVGESGLPPLLRELVRQGWFGDLLHWRAGDRVVAASVGHEDKEEPVVLFAAVTGPDGGLP
ncbi:hypothetical protein [Streptomyces sp. NPDC057616]|uniref:hypothetical protein n=1 Tax=Streptomyces sp. NPDC057616 TaxID=3346183 RepID=UPI003677F0C1